MTRRLSNRRPMSWAGGPRSKSGNRLERSASEMDFLKEEDGEKLMNGKSVASGHDAQSQVTVPRATNGSITNNASTNGAPTHGSAN